ncbi:sulfotransferase, partial [Lyngbya sp. CCY1209]|uniref:sulfotransferase n=1 Tax=Lyngbya sp. CCY1209 TaxID=2886103 RepID=UPI002D20F758
MQNLKSDQKVLIITGMHRSGTSLVASLLQSAGLHIGRRLMPSTEFNPKGYFENLDFFEFHLDVLRSQGVNIDGWTLQETIEVPDELLEKANQIVEQNSVSQIWGWKEPRTTLLLNFWADLLPESKFLLIYRSPWEVIDSLYRRGDEIFQEQPDLAVKYWLFYNQKVLEFYNQHTDRCVLANLQTIVGHQTAYIEKINHQFKTDLSHPSPAIYEPSLIQSNLSQDGHRPSLIDHYFPEAIEMYQELEGRGWHPEKTPDLSWNDRIKSSPYSVWAFRDWAHSRRVEAENKSLKAELEQSPSRDELEQTQSQLQKAESLVEQFRTQLHETEEVLEKSQAQLQKTESILKESHSQLHQKTTELTEVRSQLQSQLNLTQQDLEQAKSQLSQTQWDVMRYQSQLHSTQEELELSDLQNKELVAHQNKLQSQLNQTESQILKSEMILSQLRLQLKQAQKTEARTIAQLHYTQGELEKSQSKQHQYLATLGRLEPQLETTEIQLSQSMVKLNQSQKNQARLQVQLHQIQGELEQSQTQLQQTRGELETSQTQLQQTRGE